MVAASYRGFTYIINMVDILTKRLYSTAVKANNQENVRRFLDGLLQDGVEFRTIQSDQGSEFKGIVQGWADENGVKWLFSKAHTPQSNGIVERMNGTVRRMLYASIRTGDPAWPSALPKIVEAINSTVSFGAGKTPAQVEQDVQGSYEEQRAMRMKGKGVKFSPKFLVGDSVRRLINDESSDIHRKSRTGYFGDKVYTIIDIVPSKHPNFMDSYRLEDSQGQRLQGLYAAYTLRLVPQGSAEDTIRPVVENDEELPEDEYEIEALLNKRTIRVGARRGQQRGQQVTQYQVLWKGYPRSQATWLPRSSLIKTARDLVREYENTH
jgi:hypothetical protein